MARSGEALVQLLCTIAAVQRGGERSGRVDAHVSELRRDGGDGGSRRPRRPQPRAYLGKERAEWVHRETGVAQRGAKGLQESLVGMQRATQPQAELELHGDLAAPHRLLRHRASRRRPAARQSRVGIDGEAAQLEDCSKRGGEILSQELGLRRLLRLQGAEADVDVAWAQRARRLADWVAPPVNVDEQAAPARPSSQRVGQSRIPRVGGEL